MTQPLCIGVVGGNSASEEVLASAREVGRQIAARGATLVCGGLGGVMEAASQGASEHGGTVVGILPGEDRHAANAYVTVAVATGMGTGRNVLVARTADVLIAFPGSYGTLSEIALALTMGKRVIAMPGAWELGRAGEVDRALFKEAVDAQHAVGLALNPA